MTEAPLNPPRPPEYYRVVETTDLAHYTDIEQAPWFMERINTAFAGQASTNVRMDGTTIRWFGYYFIELGDWLWQGKVRVTDEVLPFSTLRPHYDAFTPPEVPILPPEGA